MTSPVEGRSSRRRHGDSVTLRGGRLRKTARGILTYAPWLGMVSALAMGASLAAAGSAEAAPAGETSCLRVATETPGVVECFGNVNFYETGVSFGFQGGGVLSMDNGAATDTITVGDVVTGGTLTMNVAFGSGTDAADRLVIVESVSGDSPNTINLVGTGAVAELDAGGLVLIDGPADPAFGAVTYFTAGTLAIGEETREFTLARDPVTGDWRLAAIGNIVSATPPVTPIAPVTPDEPVTPVEEGAKQPDQGTTGKIIVTGCTGTGGTFTCSGAITKTQSLAAGSGEKLTVTDEDGTSFNVADGRAIELGNVADSLGMEVSVTGNVKAEGGGIRANNLGKGDISITLAATGSIAAGAAGIYVDNDVNDSAVDKSDLTIIARGSIGSADAPIGGDGIYALHYGHGVVDITSAAIHAYGYGIYVVANADAGDMSITAEGIISSNEEGIHAWNRGAAGALTITANDDITAGDEGIEVEHDGTGDIDITANAAITAGNEGIEVDHDGDGDIDITTNAAITSRHEGIDADLDGAGDITIIASGAITADDGSVRVAHDGTGDIAITVRSAVTGNDEGIEADHDGAGDITITADGNITANWEGIEADHDGTGDITIAANGNITSSRDEGIEVDHDGTGDITITANGNITSSRDEGIDADHAGNGDITIDVNAGVTISSDGDTVSDTVSMKGGTAQTLNLDSATLIGGISATGAASAAVNIKGTVSITGHSLIEGTLNNAAGALSLDNGSTDDSFQVTDFVGGGTLTLNVAFSDGSDSADYLSISGSVSEAAFTTINLVGTGVVAELDAGGLVLVDAPSGPAGGSGFLLGSVTLDGAEVEEHGLFLRRNAANGDWVLAATDAPPPPPPPPPPQPPPTVTPPPVVEVTPRCQGQSYGYRYGYGYSTGTSFVCSGAITTRQTLSTDSGNLSVTDASGTSFDVAAGHALRLFGSKGATGITAVLDADITSAGSGDQAGEGIFARMEGAGDISITANGDISAAQNAIKARHQAEGDITVTANGDISGARNGIYAKHRGNRGDITVTIAGGIDVERKGVEARHRKVGDITVEAGAKSSITSNWKGIEARHRGDSGDVSVTADGVITAGWKGIEARIVKSGGEGDMDVSVSGEIIGGRKGVEARHHGSGDIDIAASGAFRDSRRGIETRHRGTGDIDILVEGSINARNLGIYAQHTGEGAVSIVVPAGAEIVGTRKNGIRVSAGEDSSIQVDVAGSVSGKQSLFLRGGTSQRLILRPGAVLAGVAKGEDATLELADVPTGADAAEGVLDFDAVEFSGFANLVKTGTGTWELTGDQLEKQGGASAIVEAGTLRFSDLHFTMNAGSSFSVGEGGTLELQGKNILDGGLANKGAVSFAEDSADGTLEVFGDWDGGGSLTFNADFDADTANALVIGGDASGTTRVSLRPSGRIDKGRSESVQVIRVIGSADNNAFSGEGVADGLRYKLVADGSGVWSFQAVGHTPGVPAAEAYASALAALSQPPGLMERFGDDYWRSGADAGGESASLTADVSSASQRFGVNGIRSDMTDTRARAGINVPLGDIVLGADIWQGAAQSHVSSALGNGKIGIAGHAASLSATWLASNGFYVDGQAQYARFAGALQTDGRALTSGNDGTGASASAELGWRFDLPAIAGLSNFQLAPQAQVTWSRIGFADFSGPDGLHVSLQDGTTAAARLGLAWNGTWHNRTDTGLIHGGINLHEPLDGKTGINVSGTSIASERQDTGIDATLGFGYHWQQGYSLNLEATAARQDEAEEYGANLGLKIAF